MKETRERNRELNARTSALLRKASAGFEPSATDRSRTRAAISRRVAVGVAAGAAVAAGTKSAAASLAPTLAQGAGTSVAPAAIVGTTSAAPLAVATGAGFATKIAAAVVIFGTVSAGAVTIHHATRSTTPPAHVQAHVQAQAQTPDEARPPQMQPAPTAMSDSTQVDPANANVPPAPDSVLPSDLPRANVSANEKNPIANPLQITAHAIAPSTESAAHEDSKPENSRPENSKVAALRIGAEVELLQQAQHALEAGDAPRALLLLNELAQKFPEGALSEERDAMRVLALCGAGRQEEAAKMGAAFLSAHPDSPSAARVRASCANMTSP